MKAATKHISGLFYNQVKLIGATLVLIMAVNIGSAQVINTPVAASPLAVNLGPDRMICPGNQVTLNAANNSFVTYQWCNGSTSAILQTGVAGCYWVRAYDMFGNLYTDTVHVNYTPNPTSDFAFLGPVNNSGAQSFANNSTHAAAYFWDFGDGTFSNDMNPVHSFPSQGAYTVCLTAMGDCSTDQFCQTITVTWKTNDFHTSGTETAKLDAWPSPTTGTVNLSTGEAAADLVMVTNAEGMEVLRLSNPGAAEMNFDLSNYPAGLYHVIVVIGSDKVARRIVKI